MVQVILKFELIQYKNIKSEKQQDKKEQYQYKLI